MSRAMPLIAIAALSISLWALPAPATSAPLPSSMGAGHTLGAGGQLRSPNRAYALTLSPTGDLSLRIGSRIIWRTSTAGLKSYLIVRTDGDVRLMSRGRVLWHTATKNSGSANRLSVDDNGVLTLRSTVGVVWSSRLGNTCTRTGVAHLVSVDISSQLARFCSDWQQVLVSYVTTGASSLGNATPTGTWRVQAKVRDTVLRPAGGGAYPVRFWVPYDGAYGLHDSSWQTFPYGSPLYRTQGSHGCVHVPPTVMSWFFAWAPVGTIVQIAP